MKSGVHLKHGVYAVQAQGASALSPEIAHRELELVENLGSHSGVLSELERVATYYLLIVEQAAHHLRTLADDGENPWTCNEGKPVALLSRLGTYLAGAQRTLSQLAALRGDRDVIPGDYEAYLEAQQEYTSG